MKKKSREIRISWTQLEKLSAQLARAIKASGFEPDHVVGIAMGGLIQLALVARKVGVKSVAAITARSYDGKTRKRRKISTSNVPQAFARGTRVLIIDEIADTGETLRAVSNILKARCGARDARTATLVMNEKRCHFLPD